jgi:hypothetical protein
MTGDCAIMDNARRITEIGRARFSFTPVPRTITQHQIVGSSARTYHRGVVNLHGCALSVASGSDNQSDRAGATTFYPPKNSRPWPVREHEPGANHSQHGGADHG